MGTRELNNQWSNLSTRPSPVMEQQQCCSEETVHEANPKVIKNLSGNTSTQSSMQAETVLGKDNPVAFGEICRNTATKPFESDRNKASKIHKNDKVESPVGETSKTTIWD